MLLFLSLAMAGNYYIYDSIAPVADLLSSQLGYTDTQIGWLYSIYSVSAIATLLLGGVLVDRVGVKKAGLGFALAVPHGRRDQRLVWLLHGDARGASSSLASAPSRSSSPSRPRLRSGSGEGTRLRIRDEPPVARLASVAADNSPTWAQALYETWRGPLALAVVAA